MLLLGGVGYTYLGDLSFGPILVERLRSMDWPPSVAVEDVSYNPMTVMDWLRDDPERFERAIFFGGVQRGRRPGSLTRYPWTSARLPPDRVQEHVAEAVTGSIGLDNLLVIGTHFGLLPGDTTVVELEPVATGWGEGLSPEAEAEAGAFVSWLRSEVGAVPGGSHRDRLDRPA